MIATKTPLIKYVSASMSIDAKTSCSCAAPRWAFHSQAKPGSWLEILSKFTL